MKYQRTEYAKKIRKDYEAGIIKERRCNMREYTFRTDGCSNTITTVQKDNYMKQLKLHKECTHDKLVKFGFRKYGLSYKLFLPLYKYKTYDVIIVEFLVSTIDHYIGYDVSA